LEQTAWGMEQLAQGGQKDQDFQEKLAALPTDQNSRGLDRLARKEGLEERLGKVVSGKENLVLLVLH